MIAVHFQEAVSLRTTANVAKHCGEKTYQINNDSAVGNVHAEESRVESDCSNSSSELASTAKTVPKAPTITSRAAKPGMRPVAILQSKPKGANTG